MMEYRTTMTARPKLHGVLPPTGGLAAGMTEEQLARAMAEDAKRAGHKPKMPVMAGKPASARTAPVDHAALRAAKREEERSAVFAALTSEPRRAAAIAEQVGITHHRVLDHLRHLEMVGKVRRCAKQSGYVQWSKIETPAGSAGEGA